MPDAGPQVTIVLQPIYLHVPPLASAAQRAFLHYNTAQGLIAGTLHDVDSYLDRARNEEVGTMLDQCPQATHALLLDQDIKPGMDVLRRLHEHQKWVVSATYFEQRGDCGPVAWESLHPPKRLQQLSGNLETVAGIGLGCVLIRTDVFRRMEDHFGDRNWFHTSSQGGEDLHFCSRLEEMGIPVCLDTGLKVGHVGEYEFTEKDWKRPAR